MSKNNKEKRPQNKEVIDTYLKHYDHSEDSKSMRRSSLKYFFGEKRSEKSFGYNEHIFDIDVSTLLDYFNWLKNLDIVSIQTRRNKWNILTSFLKYTMIYYNSQKDKDKRNKYEEFIVIIPTSQFTHWRNAIPKAGEVKTNAKVYATKREIEKVLLYFKAVNFGHYLIFRVFTDTGMRKGELIEATISDLNISERYFYTKKGKTGEKIYVFKEDLVKLLKIYLNERNKLNITSNILFLSKHLNKYSPRGFNLILKYACNKLKIEKNITTKTLRKTLNDYRKQMGCSLEDRERLVGHKNSKVNIKNYTKFDIADLTKTYDRWYPYEDLNI